MRPNAEKSILLEIKDLYAGIESREILKGFNLTIREGETHALMGPNGSGKSTLANVLCGHPRAQVKSGSIIFRGENLVKLSPEERAKHGLFMAFQYPVEVTGVSLFNFLKTAYGSVKEKIDYARFGKMVRDEAEKLKMDPAFLSRYLNEGFSGGEKKKAEILQMMVLSPKIVIMDETDSGLDIDALRIVSEEINRARESFNPGILLITHYFRILKYVRPDFVHVLVDGRIAAEGGAELATKLEENGYEWVRG
ncbi:MAG: Fe-S cluster assembly ATPase SufC [Patescibacteria group bacterium]|nr:Fe-S cluster assembly ATPase SufC [Patescibacteria group bacterium]